MLNVINSTRRWVSVCPFPRVLTAKNLQCYMSCTLFHHQSVFSTNRKPRGILLSFVLYVTLLSQITIWLFCLWLRQNWSNVCIISAGGMAFNIQQTKLSIYDQCSEPRHNASSIFLLKVFDCMKEQFWQKLLVITIFFRLEAHTHKKDIFFEDTQQLGTKHTSI